MYFISKSERHFAKAKSTYNLLNTMQNSVSLSRPLSLFSLVLAFAFKFSRTDNVSNGNCRSTKCYVNIFRVLCKAFSHRNQIKNERSRKLGVVWTMLIWTQMIGRKVFQNLRGKNQISIPFPKIWTDIQTQICNNLITIWFKKIEIRIIFAQWLCADQIIIVTN